MATEQLWFSQVIDGIFLKGLGERVTPPLRAELSKLGIDLARLAPAYPLPAVLQALDATLLACFPGQPRPEGLRALGALSLQGYTDTFLGRAVLRLMRLIGVRRSLLRLNISMRSGNNYLQTEAVVRGEREVELSLSDVSGIADFYRGIFEQGGRMLGVELRISDLPAAAPGHRYRVEWDA